MTYFISTNSFLRSQRKLINHQFWWNQDLLPVWVAQLQSRRHTRSPFCLRCLRAREQRSFLTWPRQRLSAFKCVRTVTRSRCQCRGGWYGGGCSVVLKRPRMPQPGVRGPQGCMQWIHVKGHMIHLGGVEKISPRWRVFSSIHPKSYRSERMRERQGEELMRVPFILV